jgi:hypothetical protein
MLTPQPIYTELANHAIELAKLFSLFVANPPIPTSGGVFAIELMTPHGPSTGGGAQALQHIRFVHGDLTIVVGTVDPLAASIELRGYDHLSDLFDQRRQQALPFARAAFEAFVLRVRGFARSQQYVVVIKDVAPALEPRRRWPLLGSLVGIALAALAVALH